MKVDLKKTGRYTYIVIDGGSPIRCASKKNAEALRDILAAQSPAGPSLKEIAKQSNVPEFADWPAFFKWNRDRTDRLVMYGDDLTTPNAVPIAVDPNTAALQQAEALVVALREVRDRNKRFGSERRVWTVMDIKGFSAADVEACKEHPENEPYARDHMNPREDPAQKDTYEPPWNPWEEWCAYEDLGPINSKIDGETQLRRSIVDTIAWKRFDEVQQLIEADPAVARFDLVLTRAWYPLTYHDRIDSVAMLQGRISSHPLLACFHTANFVAAHFGLPIGVVASENGDFQSFAPVNQQYSGYPEHFCLWQNPGAWGVRPQNRPWKLSSDRGILFL